MQPSLSQRLHNEILNIPLEYDRLVVETGENNSEPEMTITVIKDGMVIFFLNFDVISLGAEV